MGKGAGGAGKGAGGAGGRQDQTPPGPGVLGRGSLGCLIARRSRVVWTWMIAFMVTSTGRVVRGG